MSKFNLFVQPQLMQMFEFKTVPVGALTSKPYAFTARSWELSNVSSLDVFDSFNSNISISVRGSRLLRVLPKLNESLNEEWITDKVRLSYEGCSRQRLVSPMLKTENTLVPCSWLIAFETFSKTLRESDTSTFLSGRLLDLETLVALKDFSSSLGSEYRFNSSSLIIPNDLREFYLCFSDLSTFETLDLLIIIGCDLKVENPLLNLRIRKLVRQGFLKVEFFGSTTSMSVNSNSYGTSISDFVLFLEGRSLLSIKYSLAKNPFILIGYSLLKFFFNIPFFLTLNYKFAIIHPFAGYLNSYEIGFSSPSFYFSNYKLSLKNRFLFLAGVDEIKKFNASDYVVYQGHNGFAGANLANLILPSTSFFEKSVSYINNFGLQQQTEVVVDAPINVRNDVKIFESLLIFLSKGFLIQGSNRLVDFTPFRKDRCVTFFEKLNFSHSAVVGSTTVFTLTNGQLNNLIFDYFRSDSITYASKTLTLLSNLKSQNFLNYNC